MCCFPVTFPVMNAHVIMGYKMLSRKFVTWQYFDNKCDGRSPRNTYAQSYALSAFYCVVSL